MSDFHRSAAWQAFAKKMRPMLQRQLPLPCMNPQPEKGCSGVVMPGEAFDISHRPGMDFMLTGNRSPRADEVGAAHATCNRSDGAKLAAQRRAQRKARAERMPGW